MRVSSIVRSRMGRRVLPLFLLGTLLPVLVLAAVSYVHLSTQLNDQSWRALHDQAAATGNAILERLSRVDVRLELVAARVAAGEHPDAETLSADPLAWGGILGLTLERPGQSPLPVFGSVPRRPRLSEGARAVLTSGRAALVTSATPPRVFMARRVPAEGEAAPIVWAEIDRDFLWEAAAAGSSGPASAEFCVLDAAQAPVHCSAYSVGPLVARLQELPGGLASGELIWSDSRRRYHAGFRSLFLRTAYGADHWTLVVSQPEARFLAPITSLRTAFGLLLAAALLTVVLLSSVQVRRSLGPLSRLLEGTNRIADRDFESEIRVESGDEFDDLARSLNLMASRLGRQFGALRTINAIDRAALSSTNPHHVIDTALDRLREVFACDGAAVSIVDWAGGAVGWTHAVNGDPVKVVHKFSLGDGEAEVLWQNPEHVTFHGSAPSYLDVSLFGDAGIETFTVFPFFKGAGLSGALTLAHSGPVELGDSELADARQIADQTSLSLSNVFLVSELENLQIGALTALARAIDAKSTWTAGHSERVTDLAVRIAREMGLGQEELSLLNRGGLLHDIGKIGIPAAILEKDGPLTPREVAIMQDHTRIGVRILEPLGAFADVLPLVRHHHEHYDGTGYPDGVAGDEISLYARILAVADTFDAVTSDRPYRFGAGEAMAVEIIRAGAGTQFDPRVVEAFLRLARSGGRILPPHSPRLVEV